MAWRNGVSMKWQYRRRRKQNGAKINGGMAWRNNMKQRNGVTAKIWRNINGSNISQAL